MLIELGMGRFPFSGGDGDDYEYDSDESEDYGEEELTLSPVKPGSKDRSLAEHEARKREKAVRAAEKQRQEGGANPLKKEKKKKNSNNNGGGVSLGGSGSQMSILELLQHVVNEPAPKLKPAHKFKKETHLFVDSCLEKDVNRRPTPKELLVSSSIFSTSPFLPVQYD
jgi:mitogen-activated protein kinase kinase